jgi:hypothetical protein
MSPELNRFVKQIFEDADGCYSSKRLIIFIAFILLCTAFLSNLFWGFVIAQPIFDGFMYIVLVGFGFATLGEPVGRLYQSKAKAIKPAE